MDIYISIYSEYFHYLFNLLSVVPNLLADDPKRLLDIVESTISYAYLILLIERINILYFFKPLVKTI